MFPFLKSPSPFYPGFVVGDTAAARYLFLGADQPSYRAHVFTATLEYASTFPIARISTGRSCRETIVVRTAAGGRPGAAAFGALDGV